MLDFYADWCTSCKEMEKLTFSDVRVKAALANMVLLQADVTENNDNDQALLKRFGKRSFYFYIAKSKFFHFFARCTPIGIKI